MERIGSRLVADGRIDEAQLRRALERQRAEGGYVGQHLIDAGSVSRSDFYAALAAQWHLTVRDLVREPPDPDVLAEVDVEATVELGWIPCELTAAGGIVVATAVRPAEELVTEVEDHFPGRFIEFVACTQRDLDGVALSVRRARHAGLGPALAAPVPLVRRVDHAVAALLGLAALGASFVVPLSLLAVVVLVAGLVFLVAAVVQAVLGLSAFVSDRPQVAVLPVPGRGATDQTSGPSEAEGRPADTDVDLPVYSVLVRVHGGEAPLSEVLQHVEQQDYPHARLDVVLLVSDQDEATLEAVRRAAPAECVRVVRVPAADFADPVVTYDHGLALARGRYVVAYGQHEAPAPDQLRRAVAAFESDLLTRLDQRPTPTPLAGLRVARRTDPTGRSSFARLTAVDDALHLDDGSGGAHSSTLLAELTSTHFNMRLLRRLGGFSVAGRQVPSSPITAGGPAAPQPRIEPLDSTSVRAVVPGPVAWTHERSAAYAYALLTAFGRLRALRRPDGQRRPAVGDVAAGFTLPALFLSYPVLVVGALVAALRVDAGEGMLAERVAWLGLGEAVLVLSAAVVLASMTLADRRGLLAALDALALPLHWLLHAAAAWAALVALVRRAVWPRSARPA